MPRSPLPHPHGSTGRVSRHGVVATLLVSLSLLSAPTSAQESDDSPQGRAAHLTERAEQLYLAEDFVAALDSYREAYLAVSAPDLLFNLGQCHRKLGQFEEAAIFFRVYLQVEPNTPYRSMVEGLVAESQLQRSIRAARSPDPPSPPERIDAPEPLPVLAAAPAHEPAPEPPAQDEQSWTRRQRRWAWALGGVALVAGTSSAVLVATRRNRDDDPAPTSTASLGVVDWR